MNFFQLPFKFLNKVTIIKRPITRPTPSKPKQNKKSSNNQLLFYIWCDLIERYFPYHPDLKKYRVVWSGRKQTRCLASCNIEKKVVRVAPAMKHPDSIKYLEPLLYHELCHAVVGIKIVRGRRRMHTSEFKSLERLHPQIKDLEHWIESGGWTRIVRKTYSRENFPGSLFF